jgi:hypothetical protein
MAEPYVPSANGVPWDWASSYNRDEAQAGTPDYYVDDPQHPGQKKLVKGNPYVSGTQNDVTQAEGWANDANKRQAYQANYGDYQYGLGATQKGMGFQEEGLNMQRDAAMGNAPSRAEIAGRAAMDRASAGQMAAAGSVRGGAMQQQAAYRNAARVNAANEANMTQGITAERAAEMERARAGFQAGAQGYSQTGLGYTQAGLGKTGQELQNEQFQRGLNQQGFQYGMSEARRAKENDLQARQFTTGNVTQQQQLAESKRHNRSEEDIGKGQVVASVAGAGTTGGTGSDERMKQPAQLGGMPITSGRRQPPAWLRDAQDEYERGDRIERLRQHGGGPARDEQLDQMLTERSGIRPDHSIVDRGDWLSKAEDRDIIRDDPYDSANNPRRKLGERDPDLEYGVAGAPKGYARSRAGQEGYMFGGQGGYDERPEAKSRQQAARNAEVDYSDMRTKNYSDEDAKEDISSPYSKIKFKGGDITKPSTDESEEEKRPGVTDTAKTDMSNRREAMEDATSLTPGKTNERLKPKEFSDNRAKLEAAYVSGRNHGRDETLADMRRESMRSTGGTEVIAGEGDEAAEITKNARDQAAAEAKRKGGEELPSDRREDALRKAQMGVRRVYRGAYTPGRKLGRPDIFPSESSLTVRQTVPGKDMASIARSAANAEKETRAAERAADERVMRQDLAWAQPKTLPSGERIEGVQPSDVHSKNMVQPSDAQTKEDAALRMKGTPYSYKDEYRPKEQEPGEINVGPMAQELEKNPITATTVKKDPKTGMRMVDMAKLVKVQSTEIAHLQEQMNELKYGGRRG